MFVAQVLEFQGYPVPPVVLAITADPFQVRIVERVNGH